MYIHCRTAPDAPVGLQRATASRMEESVSQINTYEEQNNTRLGPITRQHVSIHQARQPDGTEFTMPTDNTTRQAQFLDKRGNDAISQITEADDEQNRKIRIELNGCWIDVRVDVNSLREALGLPPHDIFQNGIFCEYVHSKTVGPDLEDTDHGAEQPPPAHAGINTDNSNNSDSE